MHTDLATDILIVDDDMEDRVLLSRAIMSHVPKARIYAAEDGEEALAFLSGASSAMSLIFVDLRMPKMNGIEFLQALSGNRLARSATIIVWSGVEDERMKWCAFGLNATLFIEKSKALDDIEAILKDIEAFVPDDAPRARSA